MKDISKTAKAKEVFNLIQEIKQAQFETVQGFLVIGKNLSEIQTKKLWRYSGSHLENFEMFITELKMKHATAWNLIRIWRSFGEMIFTYKNLYDKLDGNFSYFRLVKLLPIIKDSDEKQKKEWLEKSVLLLPNDFNDEIREARGLITTDQCEHKGDKEYFFKCCDCKKWIKIIEKKNDLETKS